MACILTGQGVARVHRPTSQELSLQDRSSPNGGHLFRPQFKLILQRSPGYSFLAPQFLRQSGRVQNRSPLRLGKSTGLILHSLAASISLSLLLRSPGLPFIVPGYHESFHWASFVNFLKTVGLESSFQYLRETISGGFRGQRCSTTVGSLLRLVLAHLQVPLRV